MKTFIRVVEYWVPNRERTHLEHGGGLYENADALGETSTSHRFAYGEGLPGRAWQLGRPILLDQLEGSYFQRPAAAEAGLTCGIAVPIFAGEILTSVVVYFCGDDAQQAGAIELWQAPDHSRDMKLFDAHHGGISASLEATSRLMSFRRGVGLPGIVWETGKPYFIEDLAQSEHFLRIGSANKVGISRALGLPCCALGGDAYTLTFLSARGAPMAKRFEYWAPDANREFLDRVDGFCEVEGRLDKPPYGFRIPRGEGPIGSVWRTGTPCLSREPGVDLGDFGIEIERAGLRAIMAIPLLEAGRLNGVLAWYF